MSTVQSIAIKVGHSKIHVPSSCIEQTESLYGYAGSVELRNVCYYYTLCNECPSGSRCGYYHIDQEFLLENGLYEIVINSPKYLCITKNDETLAELQIASIVPTDFIPTYAIRDLPVYEVSIGRVCRNFLTSGLCDHGSECNKLHLDVISDYYKRLLIDNLPQFSFVPVTRTNRDKEIDDLAKKIVFSHLGGAIIPISKKTGF